MPRTKKSEDQEIKEVETKSTIKEEKPAEKSNWIKVKPQELEKIVIDLAKQGNSPSKIGIILRDKHSVPKAKVLGKKITKILKENKIKYSTDKEIVGKKVENLKSHLGKNKYDQSAKRSLGKQLWLLHTLNKYQ